MISEQEARQIKEEIHPSFAGYLHDGAISQRDCLASIFALESDGCIEFLYKDNNPTSRIKSIRRTSIKPKRDFELEILELLFFGGSKEIPVLEVTKAINLGSIEEILRMYSNPIKGLPLEENNLKFGDGKTISAEFTVNGVPIDSVEKASGMRLEHIIGSCILALMGVPFTVIGILNIYFKSRGSVPESLKIESNMDNPGIMFAFIGIILIILAAVMWVLVGKIEKRVTFTLPENLNEYKEKYEKLYEFLKDRPLNRRKLSDEFLAYEIAFGLNTSWNWDFKLFSEIKIDTGTFGS